MPSFIAITWTSIDGVVWLHTERTPLFLGHISYQSDKVMMMIVTTSVHVNKKSPINYAYSTLLKNHSALPNATTDFNNLGLGLCSQLVTRSTQLVTQSSLRMVNLSQKNQCDG